MSASDQSVVHTPGPWKCEHMHTSICVGDQTLASVYYGEGRSYAESQANAKLIAAAPELLEALQLLWTEVAESGNATANDFGWRKAREATLAVLRKVV